MIPAILAGIIGGVVFLNNINAFYAICIVLGIALLVVNKKNIDIESISVDNKNMKMIGALGAFLTICVSGAWFMYIFPDYENIVNVITPPLLLIAGFCMLLTTLLISEKKPLKNINTILFPILWIMLELVVNFKNNLINPKISEFILILFLLMSVAMSNYYLARIYCRQQEKNYFLANCQMSVFLSVTIITTFVINKPSDNMHDLLILSACITNQIFLIQYYIKAKKIKSV